MYNEVVVILLLSVKYIKTCAWMFLLGTGNTKLISFSTVWHRWNIEKSWNKGRCTIYGRGRAIVCFQSCIFHIRGRWRSIQAWFYHRWEYQRLGKNVIHLLSSAVIKIVNKSNTRLLYIMASRVLTSLGKKCFHNYNVIKNKRAENSAVAHSLILKTAHLHLYFSSF